MKKLVVIALALFTLNGIAQEKKGNQENRRANSERMKQMTPNDIADLKTKHLILKLDLTQSQEKKVHSLILAQAETNQKLRAERQEGNMKQKGKPSKDEFVNREKHRLDQQIKMKREMKAILTPEQYAKFEKIKPREDRQRGRRNNKNRNKR